jgi:hypothetical protein
MPLLANTSFLLQDVTHILWSGALGPQSYSRYGLRFFWGMGLTCRLRLSFEYDRVRRGYGATMLPRRNFLLHH